MKKLFLSILVALSLVIISCSKSDPVVEPDPAVTLENEINDFVWKAMNHWYFWQEDVTNLADSKDDVQDDYYTYLNTFSESRDLFESLKFSADDFSWFIPDVEEQLNSFRGISVSYGLRIPSTVVRYSQSSDDIVIFVAYVVPGSPADQAGIERGDLIYKVDGNVLNTNNFSLLNNIFRETSISLGLGKIENGSLVPKGNDVALTAVEVSENPVHYSSVIEEGGKKIGYLVYNGFRSTFHNELNDIFGGFKNQNIDELVLDLRYNGGGSVLTSAYLSSMIDGSQTDGSTFASLIYNAKRNPQNGTTFPFYDNAALFDKTTGNFTNTFVTINRLTNLTRLYVLTSGRTASASEMIINGLRPSMEVILVGLTTTGKNEGSITVVDAPATADDQIYTNTDGRSTSHDIGMQPIVFQIFNSLNQSDYADGFAPDIEIDEIDFTASILPFGNPNEPLLRAAIDNILGSAPRSEQTKSRFSIYQYDNIAKQKFEDEMYILPGEGQFIRK